ncbi:MAG: hypothetical protein HKP55_03490 [Gammaproteobacteria bacterium]|nr:hypothetical protein [Gammaproteobacteria bacterium]NNJ90719.1 hypothetical protein [Gammaproteobacteria bacterium]
MKHYFRIFSISALLFFLLNSILMQSVAEPGTPVLFTKEDQNLHIEKMKSMTPEQKARYRSEQYALLRQKAAAIGYKMPATPPWEAAGSQPKSVTASTNKPADDAFNSRHKNQLDKYRQDAADKRKAMHERLEKQRQQIKQRIATLVDRQAVKPAEPMQRRLAPPVPPAPRADNYPGGSFYAPPPPRAMGPGYPGFYQVPPAPARPWGYPY